MAFSNLFRSKKKLGLMLSSLFLSIVLFSTIFTVISSLDVNKYLATFISGDLLVQNEVLTSITGGRNGDPYRLTEAFSDQLGSIDGVESVDNVYYRYEQLPFDDASRAVLEPLAVGAAPDSPIAWTMKTGKIPVDLYGIDPGWYTLVDKDMIAGEFDQKKFDSGKYILISSADLHDDSEINTYYHPGDILSFPALGKSYEVMALLNQEGMYAATTKHYSAYGFNAFLPSSELQENPATDSDPAMIVSATLHVDPVKLDTVKQVAKTIVQPADELSLKSREDYKAELGGFITIFQTIGYGLSFVIALIGVLNYINTVLTGVLSRRNEFAVLESIGMTKKQLKRVLIYEGLYNVLFTVLITSTLGVLLTHTLAKSITNAMAFTVFSMSSLPFVLTVPVLLIIAYTVTLRAYKTLSQATIVERLREAE